jgi:Phytanoyl-CoA dioxygenase (PhyH)
MPTNTSAGLGADEVQHFRDHGWSLWHQQVFSPARLGGLLAIFEEHLANRGAVLADELDTPHFGDARLLDYLLGDEVLDLVEPLVGPDIVLWSSHFIVKEPFTGRATPWHEDSSYWEGRLSDDARIVTVWLALDPVHRGNGCMAVVDGSHTKGRPSSYRDVDPATNTFPTEIDVAPDEAGTVYFELAPGEASLHDGRIVHGARANTSGQRRAGYTMRYFPADVKVFPETNPGHRLWLARGADRAGNSYVNA